MRNHSLVAALFTILLVSLSSGFGQGPTRAPSSNSAAVEQRVESLLSKMTLEEKVDMIGGVDDFFVRGIPRLGLPGLNH